MPMPPRPSSRSSEYSPASASCTAMKSTSALSLTVTAWRRRTGGANYNSLAEAVTRASALRAHPRYAPLVSAPVNTRRQFLIKAPLGLAATLAACNGSETQSTPGSATTTPATPGAPPAFNTAPPVGPEVSPETFAEAEKLMQVTMTPAQREMASRSWRTSLAALFERRTGPRKLALEDTLAPATIWRPDASKERGTAVSPVAMSFLRSAAADAPLPSSDADIAFATVAQLSRWIETKKLTSERLTNIYLERIARLDPKLRSVITLTRDLALRQARAADREIAAGRYRGPLHGIPYGVKDLLDTAGIATTWGAEPYRDRVPATDSTVIARLNDAGAVLIAKLSLGALALNDIWFGGQTNNPWLIEEGSSGSSAGPGAATAAGCVAFAMASETGGSIIGPAMRNGVTGLRPTYGRVPRTGAMTLCWSLDKLGPMARYVEDTLIVLQAISGPDPGDPASIESHLDFDATAPIAGLRVGYFKKWMDEPPATEVDRKALDAVRKLGMEMKEVTLPDWPYVSLNTILFAEAAAAFEELTLTR